MWKQLISSIAGLGVPGLVLLVAMATTGYAGAAALTTALATLGGPLGMLGGIAVLGILAFMSKGLAEYGLDAIFKAVVDQLVRSGRSIQDLIREVEAMPIVSRAVKNEIVNMLERQERASNTAHESPQARRAVLISSDSQPEIGTTIRAWDASSGASANILATRMVNQSCTECLVIGQNTFVWHISWHQPENILISPSLELRNGMQYKLPKRGGQNAKKVLILDEIIEGCWLAEATDKSPGEETYLVLADN